MKSTTPDLIEAVPGIPDADDLPNTVTAPPEVFVPLPEPTLADVQAALVGLQQVFASTLDRLPKMLDTHHAAVLLTLETQRQSLSAAEAGALQHLIETLAAIHDDGVTVSGSPYQATVEGRTPAGFRATVTIQRTDGAAFLESLGRLESWLVSQKYTPAP